MRLYKAVSCFVHQSDRPPEEVAAVQGNIADNGDDCNDKHAHERWSSVSSEACSNPPIAPYNHTYLCEGVACYLYKHTPASFRSWQEACAISIGKKKLSLGGKVKLKKMVCKMQNITRRAVSERILWLRNNSSDTCFFPQGIAVAWSYFLCSSVHQCLLSHQSRLHTYLSCQAIGISQHHPKSPK